MTVKCNKVIHRDGFWIQPFSISKLTAHLNFPKVIKIKKFRDASLIEF